MSIRIGINGFGQLGRLALRAVWKWPDVEFVHINETKGGPETAAHLLAFDSVHGRWGHEVKAASEAIVIDGRQIAFTDRSASSGPCSSRFLRADAKVRDAYAALKRELAVRHQDDREAYTRAKADFILAVLREAQV